jgi:hypothetical protein
MTTAVKAFIDRLAQLRLPHVFNPYNEICRYHDIKDAPSVRRTNLEKVLAAAVRDPIDSLWIARDLGYLGGRRTGLALTDEIHLETYSQLIGSRSLKKATTGPVVSERTAKYIWSALSLLNSRVFLWNVFPFHPYQAGWQLTNRAHTRQEVALALPLLEEIVHLLNPRIVVAIGLDAQRVLSTVGVNAEAVRHPSHGGSRKFAVGIAKIYAAQLG